MGGCSSLFRRRTTRTAYGEGSSPNGKYSYAYASTKGYRKTMEDYFEARIFETYEGQLVGFFAVYDGHAGHRAAEYLQRNLFQNIAMQPKFLDQTRDALVEAYRHTDVELLGTYIDKDGSTAATALLFEDKLVVANVGDSRIIICRTNNTVTELTRDHKPSQLDELYRIERLGGTVLGGRINGLALSRAFGDRHLKLYVPADPETREIPVDDTLKWLVVATDGLWDVMTNEDAMEILNKEHDARAAASVLMHEALTRKSFDNITCVVVRFHN